MSKIISIHSFRGGTGKSNTTANISAHLAKAGKRVGVVDTDINSPGIHVLFGFTEQDMQHSLNDYLWGRCDIEATAHDVTDKLNAHTPTNTIDEGRVYLIPSSLKAGEITRVLREGYDVGLLNDGFHNLIQKLELDVLMIDTHPGLNEETLLSVAVSDALAIIMRPDEQDYQGTAVTVQVARKLAVPNMVIVVNKAPTILNFEEVQQEVTDTYACEVAAVLPHSDEMMALASRGVFVLNFPQHEISQKLQNVASILYGEA